MENPIFEEESNLNGTIKYTFLYNLYRNITHNVSEHTNVTHFYHESQFKLKVLWYNYMQQFYLAQQKHQLYEVPWILIIALSLLYGVISITSLAGNGLVIWLVLGSKKMRTVTNLFICNLAVADLIIGLLVVPFHFQAALLQQWHLPHFLCALFPFLQVLGVSLNALTLCTIAMDRYRAVLRPLRVKTTKGKALLLIVLIWMLSLALALPTYLDYKVVFRSTRIFSRAKEFCHSVVYSPETRMYYSIGLFAAQYGIPVAIISFAYARMGFHLWRRKIPGNKEKERDALMLKNKKQAIKSLAMVILLFGICWLPFQVYSFLQYVIPAINNYQYINIIWFCMHWVAMSNSCVNPFVYTIYNKNFQQQFRERITCCRKYNCLIGKRISKRLSGSDKSDTLEGIRLQVVTKDNLQIPAPTAESLVTPQHEVNTRIAVATKLEIMTELRGDVQFKAKLITVAQNSKVNML